MRIGAWLLLGCVLSVTTGCRCFPGFNTYAALLDRKHETSVVFDTWYNPRLDISRAGRPDWCHGRLNGALGECQCCAKGTWDRADACWLYPARYPYVYPARTLSFTTYNGPGVPSAAPVTEESALPPVPQSEDGGATLPEFPAALPPASLENLP